MKINYDMDDNFFEYYNIAQGIGLMQNKLLKNPKKRIVSFLNYCIIYQLIYIICLLIIYYLFNGTNLMWIFWVYLSILIFMAVFNINILVAGVKSSIKSKQGTVIIDENGINDSCDSGMSMSFSYDNLKLFVVKGDLIVFIFKQPFFIYFPTEKKKEVIKMIKKYSKVPIIEAE